MVSGQWSVSGRLFCVLFCTTDYKAKNPPPLLVGSGFVEVVVRLVSSIYQRRKHVRQPATGVVVMPIRGVAVNAAPKHCSGLITDTEPSCQTGLVKNGQAKRL
jgi:hypothetical protein